jgi:hypothetical protein
MGKRNYIFLLDDTLHLKRRPLSSQHLPNLVVVPTRVLDLEIWIHELSFFADRHSVLW